MTDLLRSLARRALVAPTVRPRPPTRFEGRPMLETGTIQEVEAPSAMRPGALAHEAVPPSLEREERQAAQASSIRDDGRVGPARAPREGVPQAVSNRSDAAPVVQVIVEQTGARRDGTIADAEDAASRRPERDRRNDREPVGPPAIAARETTERVVQEVHWQERLERTERLVTVPPLTDAGPTTGAMAASSFSPPSAVAAGESRRAAPADEPATPTIEIHIGRIDVRGTIAAAPFVTPRAVAAPPTARSLDEVLARRRSAA